MKRLPKVLVMAGYAPSLLNFRKQLLLDFQQAGHVIHTAAPEVDPSIHAKLAELNIAYHTVPLSRAGIGIAGDLRALISYVRLMRAVRPDLALAYTVKPVVYGLLAARLVGVRRRFGLITGRGYAFGDTNLKQRVLGRIVGALYRIALRGAERVFFQNPDDRELFVGRRIVNESQAVIVNGSGVDIGHFAEAPLPQGGPTFLLIARLLADKGIREYAQAARAVRREWPDARFLLVGPVDPNPGGIAMNEVEGWQEAGDIEYLGAVEDVRPAMRRASVFVLPSAYGEGTPRTNLEALAMGRAIITTDSPGCRETVADGQNGFLVPVRNVEKLTEAMLHFVRQPTLAKDMGRQSRKLAEAKYDVRSVNRVMLRHMGLSA
jgi:glycosyltransferase involved in cell wall biosynthesis